MSSPEKPLRRRDIQRQETAQTILEKALGLFDRLGFEHTTVDRIVEEAGVAKGTFFHHFASKDAILSWVGEQQIRNLEETISRQEGFAARTFEEQMRFILLTLGEAHAKRKGLLRFLAATLLKGDLVSGPHAKPIARLETLLLAYVVEAQRRGEARNDVDPEVLVLLIRSVYFHTVLYWLTLEGRTFAETLEPNLEVVLRGAVPRAR